MIWSFLSLATRANFLTLEALLAASYLCMVHVPAGGAPARGRLLCSRSVSTLMWPKAEDGEQINDCKNCEQRRSFISIGKSLVPPLETETEKVLFASVFKDQENAVWVLHCKQNILNAALKYQNNTCFMLSKNINTLIWIIWKVFIRMHSVPHALLSLFWAMAILGFTHVREDDTSVTLSHLSSLLLLP